MAPKSAVTKPLTPQENEELPTEKISKTSNRRLRSNRSTFRWGLELRCRSLGQSLELVVKAVSVASPAQRYVIEILDCGGDDQYPYLSVYPYSHIIMIYVTYV